MYINLKNLFYVDVVTLLYIDEVIGMEITLVYIQWQQ